MSIEKSETPEAFRKAGSFQACRDLSVGLIVGFTAYFALNTRWPSTDIFTAFIYSVGYIFFNGLLLGIVCGSIFSLGVFPVHYYFIHRYNRIVSLLFFGLGVVVGNVLIDLIYLMR